MSAALKGQMKRCNALYVMACLYAPQGVDVAGVAPPQEKWNDTVCKVA